MRVSERGQVTIPQPLRERYGLLPHTEVQFIPEESGVRLMSAPRIKRQRSKRCMDANDSAAAQMN
ncbi:MAG: AbrB/MazE/SpoVT family DNA-binding domain-containing protein [Candidatus Competibacteraceae bacterium]